MENQNPALGVPTTVSGNLSGTLAGAAATLAVGALEHAGYLTAAAAFCGLPEATVGLLAMAVVGGMANYAVTHYAGLATLNKLYAALPQTYSAPTDYPEVPPQVPTPNNINK